MCVSLSYTHPRTHRHTHCSGVLRVLTEELRGRIRWAELPAATCQRRSRKSCRSGRVVRPKHKNRSWTHKQQDGGALWPPSGLFSCLLKRLFDPHQTHVRKVLGGVYIFSSSSHTGWNCVSLILKITFLKILRNYSCILICLI